MGCRAWESNPRTDPKREIGERSFSLPHQVTATNLEGGYHEREISSQSIGKAVFAPTSAFTGIDRKPRLRFPFLRQKHTATLLMLLVNKQSVCQGDEHTTYRQITKLNRLPSITHSRKSRIGEPYAHCIYIVITKWGIKEIDQ